jgi:succinoglycan biosynthesis protein ExoV
MKVFFHKVHGGNVGDDVNAELWHRLIPELDELATADWLIGIGTILDERINALPGRKVVMGSGLRPNTAGRLQGDIRIAAVRGLLSAERLGLNPAVAACDPGFLIGQLWPTSSSDAAGIGLIPHVYSEQWSEISKAGVDAGLDVISPTLPIEQFLQRLRRCKRVYCESMHGAIFADALRIPWARVRLTSHYFESAGVSEFKWQDAFSVVGASSAPINRLALLRPKRGAGLVRSLMQPVQALAEHRLARALKKRSDDSSMFRLSDSARLQEQTRVLLSRIALLRSERDAQNWPRPHPSA